MRTAFSKLTLAAVAVASLTSFASLTWGQAAPSRPSSIPSAKTYDLEHKISLTGIVTRVDWVNPRAFFYVDVTDANGTVANWAVEFGNPIVLERDGWKIHTLKIGDAVRIEGVPARGQSRQAFARSVNRNGQALFTAMEHAMPADREVPRWPDGHPRLGPEPGKKGYWGHANAAGLVEDTGAPIEMDKDALLADLSDVDRVAPFLPWARGVYLYRQRDLLSGDPLDRCLPPGGPRQFQSANGFQFIEQPELGRVLVLHGGGDRNWRLIFTDGRELAQPDEVVQTYYGTSVGHWEGDTLVVDVVGFNERFWMSAGGLPHTEALHLTERFTRTSYNTLEYEVTVDDPRTYSRPWTGHWTIDWMDGEEIQEYFCEENAESTFER